MFSMVTVAMSTSMPIESAMPPSDMMLIVLPVSQRPTSEPIRDSGMLSHDDNHTSQVAEKSRIIRPVSAAPINPSRGDALDGRHDCRRFVELEVHLHVFRHGVAKRCIDLQISATTVNVEPVSFLMIGK